LRLLNRSRFQIEGVVGMGFREAEVKDYKAVEALYHAFVPNNKNISVSGERVAY
jgi:hypothetical protein